VADINRVILMGRVGQDPNVRDAGKGKVARFTVATTRYWKTKSGEKQERTTWHNIQWWSDAAKIQKGTLVFIEGEILKDEYEKDGQKKVSVYVQAQYVTVLSGGKTNESGGGSKSDDDFIPES
jgi:single-strand DNA-binding protein